MQNFFEWFQSSGIDRNQPWLLFGKGPSFSKRRLFDLSQYNTLSLNHAVCEQPVKVAHMIDLDVVDDCADAIDKYAEFLVLPWVPHVNCTLGSRNLAEIVQDHPFLRRMDEQNRLLWYNLSASWYGPSAAQLRCGDSPVVSVVFFSSEAALNLLALAGVHRLQSLGIDGGATYSKEFEDLKDKTLLKNGHESFDIQFAEIAKIIMRTGIDYAPLDIESPIRVYVGSMEAQMLPVKVLEYSIRKHASMNVEVLPLHLSGIDVPTPKDSKNYPRTPFSFQRFLIPALAGYRGKAIYIDSDMLVLKDIRNLWSLAFNEADLLSAWQLENSTRSPQFSVMLLNCASLKWNIRSIIEELDKGNLSYEELMYKMSVAKNIRTAIDPVWNSLEQYEEGVTALVHYTDMNTQPWVSSKNSIGYLWVRELIEAIDNGFITLDYVRNQVNKGHVRPSLLYQIECHVEDSCSLPKLAQLLDKGFVPPFMLSNQYDVPSVPTGFVTMRKTTLTALKYHYKFTKLESKVKKMFARLVQKIKTNLPEFIKLKLT